MVRLSKLVKNEHGRLVETDIRNVPQRAMMECPHFIMVSEHYRNDNTCRCNDATHYEMAGWGYQWDGSMWIAPPDDAA